MSIQYADVWRDFQAEFYNLAKEEVQIVRARMKDVYLSASGTYRRDAELKPERGEQEQGPYCLLNIPSCGIDACNVLWVAHTAIEALEACDPPKRFVSGDIIEIWQVTEAEKAPVAKVEVSLTPLICPDCQAKEQLPN